MLIYILVYSMDNDNIEIDYTEVPNNFDENAVGDHFHNLEHSQTLTKSIGEAVVPAPKAADDEPKLNQKPALTQKSIAEYAAKFEKLSRLNDELAQLKKKIHPAVGTAGKVVVLVEIIEKLEEISQHQNVLLISMNNIFGE